MEISMFVGYIVTTDVMRKKIIIGNYLMMFMNFYVNKIKVKSKWLEQLFS